MSLTCVPVPGNGHTPMCSLKALHTWFKSLMLSRVNHACLMFAIKAWLSWRGLLKHKKNANKFHHCNYCWNKNASVGEGITWRRLTLSWAAKITCTLLIHICPIISSALSIEWCLCCTFWAALGKWTVCQLEIIACGIIGRISQKTCTRRIICYWTYHPVVGCLAAISVGSIAFHWHKARTIQVTCTLLRTICPIISKALSIEWCLCCTFWAVLGKWTACQLEIIACGIIGRISQKTCTRRIICYWTYHPVVGCLAAINFCCLCMEVRIF